MTTLREAAQQALEALAEHGAAYMHHEAEYRKAITTLKAALEQPEQAEPVAWIEHGLVEAPDGLVWEKRSVGYYTPLYTHPPRHPRKGEYMTRDDIIHMAREAGFDPEDGGVFRFDNFNLERFAALVAAQEREACAAVCDARYMGDNNREDMEARRCAAAIRARGRHDPLET
jgi:hypothetical protein